MHSTLTLFPCIQILSSFFSFFFFFSSRRRHTRFLPVSWARWKLGARSHLVRGRRDLRARIVRAGIHDVGRVAALPPSLRRAAVFSGGASAATPHLFARTARRNRPANRDARASEGEGDVARVLGRAA